MHLSKYVYSVMLHSEHQINFCLITNRNMLIENAFKTQIN